MDANPDLDRSLVEAVLADRAGAFEQLVRDYQGLCWHVIQRMVRHPEDTRELCQEAFLRVHRYLHQYRFDSPLKSWIGQVAYSVARRHLERKRIPLADANANVDDLRVARAVRQAPPVGLPMDFAAQMAGLARGQAVNNSLFEQRLLRGLSVLFGLSALMTVAWYGRSWPADLAAALPGGSEAASWSMAATLCVLANWGLALLRRQLGGRGHTSG